MRQERTLEASAQRVGIAAISHTAHIRGADETFHSRLSVKGSSGTLEIATLGIGITTILLSADCIETSRRAMETPGNSSR